MMADNHREAVQQANHRRHFCCNKCAQSWSYWDVPAEKLPPSAQDAAFPGQRYDYCGACGNLRMRKASR